MPLIETPPRLEVPATFGETTNICRSSLRELTCVNRYFGGTRSLLRHLRPLTADLPTSSLRVLDVGSGGADIPRGVAAWAREAGLECSVVAMDRHPEVVREAAARSAAFPEIAHLQGDAFDPPFPPSSFDVVMSSMMVHYFPDADAERLLSVLGALARRALLIADVERHWFPIGAINTLSTVLRDRLVRRDFNHTVMRGFTPGELIDLAGAGGFRAVQVQRHFPFRLVLVAETASRAE